MIDGYMNNSYVVFALYEARIEIHGISGCNVFIFDHEQNLWGSFPSMCHDDGKHVCTILDDKQRAVVREDEAKFPNREEMLEHDG